MGHSRSKTDGSAIVRMGRELGVSEMIEFCCFNFLQNLTSLQSKL